MNFRTFYLGLWVFSTSLIADSYFAQAHFPWLSTDKQGHAMLWFGESVDDQSYPMPPAVQAIMLGVDGLESPLSTTTIERDDFIGLQSTKPAEKAREIFGSVTYGLYHGTKLTYHVEHLPHDDPATWPTQTRDQSLLQTVIQQGDDGAVAVTVLQGGKPLADMEVKLLHDQDQAVHKTNDSGTAVFRVEEVGSGLNAVTLGITNKEASGHYQGEAFQGTADYLTATFYLNNKDKKPVRENRAKTPLVQVDDSSGVQVLPSGLPDLPEELTSFGAAVAGNRLYVYGGHTGEAHSYSVEEQSSRLWCLDLSQGAKAEWKKLAGGPNLQGLAMVPAGERVVRIGGFTAVNHVGEDHDLQSRADVAIYDPSSDLWSELPALPEPRSSFDAAVLDDVVYVFGGWQLSGESDDSRWHKTGWRLDLKDDQARWQPIAESPLQRRALSVAVHQGKLFAIGGMQSIGGPTTRVDVYDPVTDSWETGPAIPGQGMSGFGSSAFSVNGCLYVTTIDGFVHQLDEKQLAWTSVAQVEPPRFFHRMLPRNSKELLMIGGANMAEGKFTVIDSIHLP